jgi:spore maturation protein CgeB
MADDLDQFYVPGKEIVLYTTLDDLVEKVRYYIAHETEREAIARAGYERSIREHTYEKRFRKIFEKVLA